MSTPENAVGTMPPPDITKDRLFVVSGGTILPLTEQILLTCSAVPVWLTAVPKEPSEQRKGSYPRERHFRVMHDVQVGTVDELVEHYRQSLTRAYHCMALTPKEGEEQPVIPMMGEASLRKQNEALDAQFPRGGVVVICKAQPEEYEAFLAPKYDKYDKYEDPKPRQTAMERDTLMRLVAAYASRRFREGVEGESLHDLAAGVTDHPLPVQRLIDALTVLKDDAEARHANHKARADAACKTTPAEYGTDVAKD